MNAGPRRFVLDDPEALAAKAAALFVEIVDSAVRERGVAHVALTGGSSAPPLYRRLGDPRLRERIQWDGVHLWWGDERLVPADHPLSNAAVAYGTLFDTGGATAEGGQGQSPSDAAAGLQPGVFLPAENVHPFRVDGAIRDSHEGTWAAEQYADELRRSMPADRDGLPIFDLILLGVGPDAHVLSVFPDSPAFAEDAPLVVAVPAPTHVEPHVPRLTLNPRLLGAARSIVVMASGRGKADVLRDVLEGPREPRRRPAQLALGENAIWLLDRAAASALTPTG